MGAKEGARGGELVTCRAERLIFDEVLLAAPALAQEENGGGHFCENPDAPHPVVQGLAERYGVEYEEMLGYFCEGTGEEDDRYGLGEIAAESLSTRY
jgi:hypothetical protein